MGIFPVPQPRTELDILDPGPLNGSELSSPHSPREASGPIVRRKLSEDVAARIEAAITAGVYNAGDRLPSERELMVQFGVGRPSIREALFALRRMGPVDLKSGERARIAEPTPSTLVRELSGVAHRPISTPDGMRHFQQARSIFESALAEHAAREATADDIRALKAALLANEAAVGDSQRFQRADIEFHFVIAQIPKNPILTALHAGLADWLAQQRAISIHSRGSVRAALAAHTRIYQAIADRDADAAGGAMRDHLAEVARYYWAAVNAE